MKKNIYYIVLCLIALGTYSCQDLDELNKNPNKGEQTHPELLLTDIQAKTFQVEGTPALYASRMIIQTGEESSYQYYKWGSGSFNNYNILRQVTKMIEEAKRLDDPNYIALGKFFRAYHFYQLSMKFGDIPYTEALQGESTALYQPKYDRQENVFEGILNELDEAEALLSPEISISGDIIYNGNHTKWKKLINSFQLKVLITLSHKTTVGSTSIADKFNQVASRALISSLEDNAQLEFQDQLGSRYGEFNSSSYGSSMYMASTYVDLLKDLQDPRLFVVAEHTASAASEGLPVNDFTAYNGGNPADNYAEVQETLVKNGNISKVNRRYYKDPTNEPHNILSYWEVEFILAEAATRGWINTNAVTHFQNAVRANLMFYQLHAERYTDYFNETEIQNYLNQPSLTLEGSVEEQLETIITQKYITGFLQTGWRIYYDYLRTGFPEFQYPQSLTPPYRFVYPNSEYNNNTINLEAALNAQFGGNDGIRQQPWWLQ
ncbi:hypothetical protein GGR32_001228 [Mesonia hippocampi]|uniref:SusD/RagB family nutrient-binding outer membrane lipoprotein n=1 Tax=Mesonia hippocampi TaxID=1628250 RepID=A0A840EVQ7_9FLAO|nr:SusD/RagB family nutrient-binding outer membrane lipoprotein [Mesonia hippocampi]MBB4118937.1 hypothetical protein [Mesonia hippocampi]